MFPATVRTMSGSPNPFRTYRRLIILGGAILLGLLIWAALWIIFDFDHHRVREELDQLMQTLQQLPAPLFFGAVALLPLVGVPITALYLAGGAVYGTTTGLIGVGIALLVNLTLNYWIAATFARPYVERWIARRGYPVPDIPRQRQTLAIIIVRFTPGAPLLLQNGILGLARVPFPRFLIISWTAEMIIASGYILTGESLLKGHWHFAAIGAAVVVCALIAGRLIFVRAQRKNKD